MSKGAYIYLPYKTDPKVILNIANSKVAENSFELYNPFSTKAKFLKHVLKWFSTKSNVVFKKVYGKNLNHTSSFVNFLEVKIGEKVFTSLYISTLKDKLVIQLQSNSKILGYLKFPMNEIGQKHILNEEKGLRTLAALKIVPESYKSVDSFQNKTFILLNPIKGDIITPEREEVKGVLNALQKQTAYTLKNHPRVKQLQEDCSRRNDDVLLKIVNEIKILSKKSYKEVYEHGDFAPWNLIKTSKGLVPFDFEYFEINGLEHLDWIKYHYQISKLLHKKEGKDLIKEVKGLVDLDEFEILFGVFLVKEILIAEKEGVSAEFEERILKNLRFGEK